MDLLEKQDGPGSFLERAETLVDSHGAVVLKYALNAQLAHTPISIYLPKRFDMEGFIDDLRRKQIPDDVPLYVIAPTVVDPSLAPAGGHILLACTVAPSDMFDKRANDKVLVRVERRMQKLYPGLEKHTLWKQRHGINCFAAVGGRGYGEAVGLAQSCAQDGENRFSPRTPIEGLYIVGADTGAHGIGTERAASSALAASELILADLRGLSR